LASESSEKEVVCIPGLRGQKSKEITVRNLASIIEARMVEIIEKVNNEIQNSGYAKEIIGGIVVTGGGSKLKHLTQLFEYLTGMDARIGYPNEHLANTNDESLTSPIYSTGIGLVLKGFEKNARPVENTEEEEPVTKGKFFDKVLKGVKDLFEDE
jgi:cell division protein FtsA